MMRRLICLPFKILWHILRFTFRATVTVLLSIVVFLFAFYLLNTPAFKDSAITKHVNAGVTELTAYLTKSQLGQEAAHLAMDYTEDLAKGTRWEEPQATIYIASTDETFRNAYLRAIENWNATGAFTFILVDQEKNADIVATDYEDSQSPAAGLAESTANNLTRRLVRVEIKLNRYYLLNPVYGYDTDRILYTAEHELGHAIGLDHEDNDVSVMATSGSFYTIQATDIAKVQALYAE